MRTPKTDTNIREWYHECFPTDDYWKDLDSEATFETLLKTLLEQKDICECLGKWADSLIRERVFEGLAKCYRLSYKTVYELWLLPHTA